MLVEDDAESIYTTQSARGVRKPPPAVRLNFDPIDVADAAKKRQSMLHQQREAAVIEAIMNSAPSTPRRGPHPVLDKIAISIQKGLDDWDATPMNSRPSSSRISTPLMQSSYRSEATTTMDITDNLLSRSSVGSRPISSSEVPISTSERPLSSRFGLSRPPSVRFADNEGRPLSVSR